MSAHILSIGRDEMNRLLDEVRELDARRGSEQAQTIASSRTAATP